MKTIPHYLILLMSFFVLSCSNENLDDIISEEIEENPDPDTANPDPDPDITSSPCDFDFSAITTNSTINIDCVLDLKGETFNLPANVNFDFDGGDIINGKLVFSGGYIDGELLDSSLTIEGDARLKELTFKFRTSRWDVVEGETTSDQALKNRDHIEDIITMVKRLEGNTMEIDQLDAYFEVSKATASIVHRASLEAINIPSDFTLNMTSNTHLRVYPNSRKTYALLAIRDASNAHVNGGFLYGDRDFHDYSDGGTHEWGYMFFFHAAVNSTLTGTTLKDATGDGVKIQSMNFTFQDTYKPAHEVTVSGCIFDNNRRNNMSITGGYNIYVDDNQFLNASLDTDRSEGIAPGFAIDIEATRTRDETTGELIFYERAEDIFITNNVEKNSRAGGFTVAIGYDVTIENNTVESGISYSLANGVKIIGNTVTATSESKRKNGTGIKAGRKNASDETIFNNLVSGNTVRGFGTGIIVTNRDVKILDNTVEDFAVGIAMIKLTKAEIKNNNLNSLRDGSLGLSIASTILNDVLVDNNDVTVDRNPFKTFRANLEPEASNYCVNVQNNTFSTPKDSSTLFLESKGIIFNNNQLDHGIEIFNCENVKFSKNTVTDSDDHGFHLREVNNDIDIASNIITVNENRECVRIENTTSTSEVSVSNNTCR